MRRHLGGRASLSGLARHDASARGRRPSRPPWIDAARFKDRRLRHDRDADARRRSDAVPSSSSLGWERHGSQRPARATRGADHRGDEDARRREAHLRPSVHEGRGAVLLLPPIRPLGAAHGGPFLSPAPRADVGQRAVQRLQLHRRGFRHRLRADRPGGAHRGFRSGLHSDRVQGDHRGPVPHGREGLGRFADVSSAAVDAGRPDRGERDVDALRVDRQNVRGARRRRPDHRIHRGERQRDFKARPSRYLHGPRHRPGLVQRHRASGEQRDGVLRARARAARGQRDVRGDVLATGRGDEARDGDARHGLVAAAASGRIRDAPRRRSRAVLLRP